MSDLPPPYTYINSYMNYYTVFLTGLSAPSHVYSGLLIQILYKHRSYLFVKNLLLALSYLQEQKCLLVVCNILCLLFR